MKFSFIDKESYLKWRAEWRATYKELSQKIRAGKRQRKMFTRQYRYDTTAQGFKVRELIFSEPNPTFDPAADFRVQSMRAEATFYMEQLAEAKALSWSMKQDAAKTAATDKAA